jgi:hypothetical protein
VNGKVNSLVKISHGKNRMKKRFAVLMVCCGFMMLQVPYAAGTAQAAQAAQTAQTVPPYVGSECRRI